jgi:F-type H+-transporting ATPase subunit c
MKDEKSMLDKDKLDPRFSHLEHLTNDDVFHIEYIKVAGEGFQAVLAAKAIGAGLATISLAGVGMGIGTIFGSYLEAYCKNPSLKDELFKMALLGFALTEAIALFGLLMAFLIYFS